jgi:hypothetical protein
MVTQFEPPVVLACEVSDSSILFVSASETPLTGVFVLEIAQVIQLHNAGS